MYNSATASSIFGATFSYYVSIHVYQENEILLFGVMIMLANYNKPKPELIVLFIFSLLLCDAH